MVKVRDLVAQIEKTNIELRQAQSSLQEAEKLASLARSGATDVQQVVIKCFSLRDGSSLPQIVRENRALPAAKRLGLILEHELTDERFYYVMKYILEGDRRERLAQARWERAEHSGSTAAVPEAPEGSDEATGIVPVQRTDEATRAIETLVTDDPTAPVSTPGDVKATLRAPVADDTKATLRAPARPATLPPPAPRASLPAPPPSQPPPPPRPFVLDPPPATTPAPSRAPAVALAAALLAVALLALWAVAGR